MLVTLGGQRVKILRVTSIIISPYSDTAESFIKIRRIKEMITNLRIFDCELTLLVRTCRLLLGILQVNTKYQLKLQP